MGLREFFGKPQPTTREEGDAALEKLNEAKADQLSASEVVEKGNLRQLAEGRRKPVFNEGLAADLRHTASSVKRAQKTMDNVVGRAKVEAAKMWVRLEDLSHNLFRADVARPGSREMNGILQQAANLEIGTSFKQELPEGKTLTIIRKAENEYSHEIV